VGGNRKTGYHHGFSLPFSLTTNNFFDQGTNSVKGERERGIADSIPAPRSAKRGERGGGAPDQSKGESRVGIESKLRGRLIDLVKGLETNACVDTSSAKNWRREKEMGEKSEGRADPSK